MPRNIVYFDLETMRSAGDVGGWDHKDKMGMSIGVTYSTAAGQYMIYDEPMAEQLIDELAGADLVVGYNHIDFDYRVLQGYSLWDVTGRMRSLDLMVELETRMGYRPKLEDVAIATLGTGKTADGVEAIKWWREGKIMLIAEYCCFDVKVTRMVHEYGVAHKKVRVRDRFGRDVEVEVDWSGAD